MTSLVIGSSSQLAYYFPKNYMIISSREIDLRQYQNKFYDRVFLCFAEQRTFIENDLNLFLETNVTYTLKLIEFFISRCNKLIVYGTSELWNQHDGEITIDSVPSFDKTPYIFSKGVMTLAIKQLRMDDEIYKNVIILHPCNFNSIHRKEGFLFSKIFNSIKYKKKIEIGDTNFKRCLVHPKYVVERSILAEEDEIIGSGRLTFVNDFIRELYKYCNLKYEDYVSENYNCNLKLKRKIYYLDSKQTYNNLLEDTVNDIKKIK